MPTPRGIEAGKMPTPRGIEAGRMPALRQCRPAVLEGGHLARLIR